jgi:hypothetical protein
LACCCQPWPAGRVLVDGASVQRGHQGKDEPDFLWRACDRALGAGVDDVGSLKNPKGLGQRSG